MKFIGILSILCAFALSAHAQLTPQTAAAAMTRGINMGNTLESPSEGSWGNPLATEAQFDDYKNAGFTCVRIPITWDTHTDAAPPYTINAAWLNRVEQIVDWGLKKHLIIIINAHHEGWIKNSYTAANKARFDSIWSQVATRFKNKSDSLLFEMINEPYPLSQSNVDDLNARILQIIRRTNPTRIVLFSGYMWSNSEQLVVAAIPQDPMLMGYYHSYDPYPFGLNGTGSYGTDADMNATKQKFDQVGAWSAQHNIPVLLGEFGVNRAAEYNSRMTCYATAVEQAVIHHVPFAVWEDGGTFKFYNRTQHTWDEVRDILIHTYPESPNHLRINNYGDTLIQLRWRNRTAENDSITIERRIDAGSFALYTKVAPADSQFIDAGVSTGKTYYYRLRANLKDSIEIQSYPVCLQNKSIARAPYNGTPAAVPGTVEAENFDVGVEGVAYHDSDAANRGGAYRTGPGVDIYQNRSTYYVSSMAVGEWLEYTINVQEEADYTITAAVGTMNGGGAFTLQFQNGTTDPFVAISTYSSSVFTSITHTMHLAAGQQIMRLTVTAIPDFSINKITFTKATSIGTTTVPDNFRLFDNYPNPFNPTTTIGFTISAKSFVTLKIFDLVGREVAVLAAEQMEPGVYQRTWNAATMPSGVYFCKLSSGKEMRVRRMVLLK